MSMRRAWLPTAFALVVGACATNRTASLTPELEAVLSTANEFVRRNGYTVAGHPSDLPVQRVELYDSMKNDKELVEERRNKLSSIPFAVEKIHNAWLVLFRAADGREDCPYMIVVPNNEKPHMGHGCYLLPNPRMRYLPTSEAGSGLAK
jgi:hypothetical protein